MKKIALAAILFLFPFQTWAVCSVDGYTVIYVNGIFTTRAQAEAEQKILQDIFEDSTGRSDVKFLSGYNPSHLAGAGDLLKSVQQAYKDENIYIDDYDLQTILRKIEPDVKTRKILLLGYSQGTFYTNALYNYLVANGVPKESITVYNVGTPASYVAGQGTYLTSANDLLIRKVRETASFGGAKHPLEANIIIPPVEEIPTPHYPGHSFKNVYLPKATVRIIGEVQTSLNALEANESSAGGCFTPPPVTLDYKIKEAGFTAFDPAAEGVKVGVTYAFKGAKFVIDTGQGALNAVGSAIRSLLPKADTATAIEAFDVVRDAYGSSLSKEELLDLNSSAPSIQKKKGENFQVFPYMETLEEPKPEPVAPTPGEVLGEFIEAPPSLPPPPPVLSFAPVTTNGPLVGGGGGGGGGSAPQPEPTPTPEPEPVVEPAPEPEPTPVSELSVTSPTDSETIATTTVTVSGTAPADTEIAISDGTTTSTTTSDGSGAWTTEFSLSEGPVALSVSAYESALGATTTVTRNFMITLPCVVPDTALVTTQTSDINETWDASHGPYAIEGNVYIRSGSISMGPGTIVKFKPDAALILHADVNVTIAGTASTPVIFTAINDDAGGDTNCDNAATSPAAGDWGYVSFGEGSLNDGLQITHLKARYGGGVPYQNGISPILALTYQKLGQGVSYALQTLDISRSAHTGLYLYVVGTNTLSISNSSFTDNATYGIYRNDSASPSAGAVYLADNWWGDVSGPYHATLNAEGVGNAVSASASIADVTLTPWLSASPF